MQGWELFILEYARSHEPWSGLVTGMEGMVDLPYSFALARRGDRHVLIDTGFMQTGPAEAFPLKFTVSDWISPVRMLAAIDVTPDKISDIILTHAHFDHAGAVAEFPDARIHVQKRELLGWYEAIALPPRFGHLTRIVEPATLHALLDASISHRVVLVDGDVDDVLPGIHLRLGPGHTPGHQYVVVETTSGPRVISGDCLYTARQLAGHDGDGTYIPLTNATGSLLEQLTTLDRVAAEIGDHPERLVILHDTGRWRDLERVADVEGHRIVRVDGTE